ncbi:MAG: hypothetical protein WCD42_03820 [Rhizomicrobium sp.]
MSTALLTAVLALLSSTGTLSSVAVTILTELGVSGDAVTVLKAISTVLSQSSVIDKAVENIAAQLKKWCEGDASVSAEDLIALCDAIKTQSASIQAIV